MRGCEFPAADPTVPSARLDLGVRLSACSYAAVKSGTGAAHASMAKIGQGLRMQSSKFNDFPAVSCALFPSDSSLFFSNLP